MDTKNTNEEWQEILPKSDNWDFDQNPKLEGEFVRSYEHFAKDGRKFFIHILWVKDENEEDKEVKVMGSVILDPRFANCEAGTYVKIEFLGFETSAGTGNQYRNFKLQKRKELDPTTSVSEQFGYRDAGKKDEDNLVLDLPEDEEEGGKIRSEDIPF